MIAGWLACPTLRNSVGYVPSSSCSLYIHSRTFLLSSYTAPAILLGSWRALLLAGVRSLPTPQSPLRPSAVPPPHCLSLPPLLLMYIPVTAAACSFVPYPAAAAVTASSSFSSSTPLLLRLRSSVLVMIIILSVVGRPPRRQNSTVDEDEKRGKLLLLRGEH